MADNKPQPDPPSWRLLLRRSDQAFAAGLVAVSLVAIGLVWMRQHAAPGGALEIDRAEPQTADFVVDINQADWPELTLLPNIGETLAQRIVESREAEGPFIDHSDLQRVRGIGPKTVESIRPYLLPLPGADNIVGR